MGDTDADAMFIHHRLDSGVSARPDTFPNGYVNTPVSDTRLHFTSQAQAELTIRNSPRFGSGDAQPSKNREGWGSRLIGDSCGKAGEGRS